MLIFEKKIEGKRKGSVNVVHEGFIYTKNNVDSLKTRCHRWGDGGKGTAFIQDNHFHLNIKCQHEPEMSEVKKRKVESEIKNTVGTTCTPLKQIYDSHVSIESKLQPFVKLQWAMGERRKKITTHTNRKAERLKNSLKGPALLHRALGKWPKSLTIFFYCSSVIWHANRWKMCQSFTLMVHLRLCRKSLTSC